MHHLLRLSAGIDAISRAMAAIASLLVLTSCLISAGNAFSRYLFSASSNGWLEIQWQMFAGIFLLGAAWVFKLNEHVRVDLLYGSRSMRGKLWTDVFGLVFFFFPAILYILSLGIPFFLQSLRSEEHSSNAGGLIQWPVKLLLPVGFALLALQGVSELIKRIAALRGTVVIPEIVTYEKPLQ